MRGITLNWRRRLSLCWAFFWRYVTAAWLFTALLFVIAYPFTDERDPDLFWAGVLGLVALVWWAGRDVRGVLRPSSESGHCDSRVRALTPVNRKYTALLLLAALGLLPLGGTLAVLPLKWARSAGAACNHCELVASVPAYLLGSGRLYEFALLALGAGTLLVCCGALMRGPAVIPAKSLLLLALLMPVFHVLRLQLTPLSEQMVLGEVALRWTVTLVGAAIGLYGLGSRRKPSFARNLVFHWFLFAWINNAF